MMSISESCRQIWIGILLVVPTIKEIHYSCILFYTKLHLPYWFSLALNWSSSCCFLRSKWLKKIVIPSSTLVFVFISIIFINRNDKIASPVLLFCSVLLFFFFFCQRKTVLFYLTSMSKAVNEETVLAFLLKVEMPGGPNMTPAPNFSMIKKKDDMTSS